MRCGRRFCTTPGDDVRQFKMVTLCRAHRLAMALPTIGETEKRVATLQALKAKHEEFRKHERKNQDGSGRRKKEPPK